VTSLAQKEYEILGYGMNCFKAFTPANKLKIISAVRYGCSNLHSGEKIHN